MQVKFDEVKQQLISEAARFTVIDQQNRRSPSLLGAEFTFALAHRAIWFRNCGSGEAISSGQSVEQTPGRVLTLGSHLSDLYLTFEIGGRDTFDSRVICQSWVEGT